MKYFKPDKSGFFTEDKKFNPGPHLIKSIFISSNTVQLSRFFLLD